MLNNNLLEGPLYTDFYQLTMAQLYYEQQMHETPARFEHFFRSYPDYGEHQAGYCIQAGTNWFLNWLEDLEFSSESLEKLRRHKNSSGEKIFSDEFLNWLSSQNIADRLTVEAIPEGRVVHPTVPLTVVEGPLALAQLVETALLNQLNYQVLIATRAARVSQAGRGNLLLEFGLRRAHDRGGHAGARAALIGGADFSSNTGLSYHYNQPPKGTHAHSMIQAYIARGKTELEAFRDFASLYPDSCVLLVDTIDTLQSGLPNAIKVFDELKKQGHQPLGIRLDSGDLAHLAVRSARILNDAGHEDVNIVLSNQLDEQVLRQIIEQIEEEAPEYNLESENIIDRLVYGVGTRLITSAGDSSLGGVYKLVALEKEGSPQPVLKISENLEKIPTPGHKKIWRIYDGRGRATADLIGQPGEEIQTDETVEICHPFRQHASRRLQREEISEIELLHEPFLKSGERLRHFNLEEARQRRREDLARLDPGVKRIMNPHYYHVSLTRKMRQEKQELINSIGMSSKQEEGF